MNGERGTSRSVLETGQRWSLILVGISAVVLSLSSYAIDHDSLLFDALTAIIPMGVGLWIAAVGYQVIERGFEPNRIWHLTCRTLLGSAIACVGTMCIILLLGISLVGSEAIIEVLGSAVELSTTFVGQLVLADLVIATVIGAGGGLLIGIYEDRMAQRTLELERANERLDEFAAVVSHDLRNPLTVAELNMHLARESGEKERFDAVERAHARMEEIIEDVLTLARDGDQVVTTTLTDVDTVAQDAWETTDTRDGTLSVRPVGKIRADPARLKTLFENLFRNALDHGGPTTTVFVGPLGDGGFYVADDGPGIQIEERDHVFEAGYTTSQTGTGFGLTIVKRIAQAHGWTVTVAGPTQAQAPTGETVLQTATDSGPTGARFEFRPG
ncbi:sensor histidine kinase [Haloarchaeobius sp. TZWWS8]|uniref:sensor histidine kinase n=1 Tax=Haloarchaeobius sp. TZWWS8 TaxID=3446121 RepID=UPI003EB7BB6E